MPTHSDTRANDMANVVTAFAQYIEHAHGGKLDVRVTQDVMYGLSWTEELLPDGSVAITFKSAKMATPELTAQAVPGSGEVN